MIDTYISIDLETTGLNPAEDRIIEVGAVLVEDGIIKDTLDILINPGIHIPAKITEITGITDAMVKDAPQLGDVIHSIFGFLGNYIILGHNVQFDYSFLKKAASDFNIPFARNGIDTCAIAKKVLPDIKSRSLEYLCGYFNIKNTHHRALADAYSALEVYKRLCLISYSDSYVKELHYRIPRQEPATDKQKAFLRRLIAGYNIIYDKDIEGLTKSMASKEIDGILSVYGIRH